LASTLTTTKPRPGHLLSELRRKLNRNSVDLPLPALRSPPRARVPASFPYPIVWTDVLTPYSTADNADKPIAVFGALSFWWFGEHGSPRLDTSAHVWFANDQLAVRFIEEIDFDYAALDSTAVLLTAAA
jgi:hypothetical protein